MHAVFIRDRVQEPDHSVTIIGISPVLVILAKRGQPSTKSS